MSFQRGIAFNSIIFPSRVMHQNVQTVKFFETEFSIRFGTALFSFKIFDVQFNVPKALILEAYAKSLLKPCPVKSCQD